ncbi:MAG: hypothetical protein ABSB15_03500 [Bryobacteraceae bacterium]|jgi:hypothetical protein
MIRIRRLLLPLVFLVVALMLANRAGKRTQFNREMNAVKAITTTIHTAETQYYSQHGRYAASLAELGKAGLIGRDLAKGEKGGFRFTLRPTATSYTIQLGGRSEEIQYDDRRPATRTDPVFR